MFKNLTDNQKFILVVAALVVSVITLGFFNTLLLAIVIYIIKEYKTMFKWMIIGLLVAMFGGNILGWLSLPCIIYGIILYGKEQMKKDEERWAKQDAKEAAEKQAEQESLNNDNEGEY